MEKYKILRKLSFLKQTRLTKLEKFTRDVFQVLFSHPRVVRALFSDTSHDDSLLLYRNWIHRGRYKYVGRVRATQNNALDYSGGVMQRAIP